MVLRTLAFVGLLAASSGVVWSQAPAPAAGTVRGVVMQPPTSARPSTRPAIAAPPTTHEPADRRIAVVYVDAVARRAFDALPHGRARMDQRREHFVPRVLAITAGTTVDFPNNDLPFHNVMSLAPGNAFDLGRYPRGQSRAVRFDTPGIVPVICDIHAHMSAWILVFSHPYFAVTDDAGRFTLPGVPPGVHSLHVWSELGGAEPRRVTVTTGGITDVEFRVERGR